MHRSWCVWNTFEHLDSQAELADLNWTWSCHARKWCHTHKCKCKLRLVRECKLARVTRKILRAHSSPAVSFMVCMKYGKKEHDIVHTSETVRLKNIHTMEIYQHLSCHCIAAIKSLAEMARFSLVPWRPMQIRVASPMRTYLHRWASKQEQINKEIIFTIGLRRQRPCVNGN